jgi:hypothetical protein
MNAAIITNEGVTVAVKTPSRFKKICKLFFPSKDTSLYIHFYSNTKNYYYGLAHLPAGVNKVDINFKNGRKVGKAPKLSYHESGQVHFKLGEDKESIEMVKATPLAQLNDKHIITIHVSDLEAFDDCDVNKKKNYCVIELQEDLPDHKLTIYGSTKDISNKYPAGFVLGRDRLSIFFGLLHSNPDQPFENPNGFYAISGWDQTASNVETDANLLFLMSDQ